MAVSVGGRFKQGSTRFIFAAVLSVLIGCCSASVWAGMVFYQPLLRDQHLTTEQWLQILNKAQIQGMTALVLQWGQHGDVAFYSPQGPSSALIAALRQRQTPVWLGLYADPDYFKQMQSIGPQKQIYFKQQLKLSLQVRRQWLSALKQQPLKLQGWYLPMELNDTDFKAASYLSWLVSELKSVSTAVDQPLAISLYYNGSLGINNWLSAAQQLKNSSMQLWVQDGAGAALVSEAKRQDFLQHLPCTMPVIQELFRQNSKPGEVFQARSLTADERQSVQGSCHPAIYFELRYMPAAEGLLPLVDPVEPVKSSLKP